MSQMNAFQKVQSCRNPPDIVYVDHGTKSSGQLCQGIKNIVNPNSNTTDQYWNWGLSSLWWLQTSKSRHTLSLSFTLQLWSYARCFRMCCVATVTWWALLVWVTWNPHRNTQLFQVWWYGWSKVTTGVWPDIRCQQHSSRHTGIWMTDHYYCVDYRTPQSGRWVKLNISLLLVELDKLTLVLFRRGVLLRDQNWVLVFASQ
jgi:hypothetical protein